MAVAGVLVAAVSMAACLAVVWRTWRIRVRGRHATVDAAPAPLAGKTAGRVGRRVEARLAGRLLAGELTAEQYRNTMAALAADDERRHPMVVPPDR